jgi:hypothetical protein
MLASRGARVDYTDPGIPHGPRTPRWQAAQGERAIKA